MNETSTRPVRRTASEWREIVSRYERSGVPSREFCKREAIGVASLHRWRRKLADQLQAAPKTERHDFVEVGNSLGGWAVDIELPDGRMLRIHG